MKLHDKILPTKSSYETDTFMNLKCNKKRSTIGINIAHGWVTGVMIVLLKATTPTPAMTHPS